MAAFCQRKEKNYRPVIKTVIRPKGEMRLPRPKIRLDGKLNGRAHTDTPTHRRKEWRIIECDVVLAGCVRYVLANRHNQSRRKRTADYWHIKKREKKRENKKKGKDKK